MATTVHITRIDENSEYLSKVINLWRKNSDTLGFFPEGAFYDYAKKQCILVAYDNERTLLGYLLFREVRRILPQITIVHLCVGVKYRGHGIAKSLVNELRDIANKSRFFAIRLACRRDYAADELWPKLGFVYVNDKTGRSELPLSIWQMSLRQLPLESLLYQQQRSGNKFCVVVDANVLYHLQDAIPEDDVNKKILSEEAKALQADWLSDDIDIFITDETFNEIQRNEDSNVRQRRLAYAHRYHRLVTKLEDVQVTESKLQGLFSACSAKSITSDIKQIAHAIVGDADFFVTQDDALRKKSESIYTKFGLKILFPGELIGRIDEVLREVEYQPARLAGSQILTSKLHSDHIDNLFSYFGLPQLSEKKKQFQKQLRNYIAHPDKYEVHISQDQDTNPLSLIVYERIGQHELLVPMLRIARSSLSSTILRQLLSQTILTSAKERRSITRISDTNGTQWFERALYDTCFMHIGEDWIKVNLWSTYTAIELLKHLKRIQLAYPALRAMCQDFSKILSEAYKSGDVVTLATFEKRLWPGKVIDANILNFVVPIKPIWAQHLFDEKLAKLTLWGAKPTLAFSNENVYYRSTRNNRGIHGPSRVLWYVTDDRVRQEGRKCIRAVSHLDEVIIGKPKELFRQFKRLGIYQWKDLMKITKGDSNKAIMALRFSDTELFPCPISLDNFREIIKKSERKNIILQSPQPISSRSFARIYKMGMC